MGGTLATAPCERSAHGAGLEHSGQGTLFQNLFAQDARGQAQEAITAALGRCARIRLELELLHPKAVPNLHFGSERQPDLFHAVLSTERPLFIEDLKAPALVGKLPVWWSSLLGTARSSCLIPLPAQGSPVAFL